ncbi:Enkurin domain-containing protein [Plasmodiophora brassicae]|uniref:Enkurin domain-containing protein n=1 Tax=Plasmodiophora brassicae TaxID=37360 RepID=A0A0G4IQ89_PLABS|nr:hypothetical protein PBRA_000661 [Plasmodiophora brassicae]
MTTRDQPRPSKMEKLINDVFSDRLSPHQKIAMRKALQGKGGSPGSVLALTPGGTYQSYVKPRRPSMTRRPTGPRKSKAQIALEVEQERHQLRFPFPVKGKDMQAEKDRFQRKLEKLALSNVMSNTTPTKGPSGTRSMEDQLAEEIDSRLKFLDEMRSLKQSAPFESQIRDEITERLKALKQIKGI